MNLKEAFRYQKFLDRLINDGITSISDGSRMLKITKEHMLSAIDPSYENKTEEVERSVEIDNDKVADMMLFLIEQKELLTKAIDVAKFSYSTDIDAVVASNKQRRAIADGIKFALSHIKSKESIQSDYGYKFNNDGEQVRYVYGIKVTQTEAYNPERYKAIMKELLKKADSESALVDEIMTTANVEYKCLLDVNDNFIEALEEYTSLVKE